MTKMITKKEALDLVRRCGFSSRDGTLAFVNDKDVMFEAIKRRADSLEDAEELRNERSSFRSSKRKW